MRVMRLGILGGSGVYGLPELANAPRLDIETPYGLPSTPVVSGKIGVTEVLFIPRHGAGHVFSPSLVPYRANIYAMKELGATHILSLSAVGSLREELPPRSIVLPDQIVDRTHLRPRTFFDSKVVAHVGIADPYCGVLRESLATCAENVHRPLTIDGTYVCIEGPQFSTRAESQLHRSWGASVVGMTAMPEARLAREAGLCYAMLAMVTDFDVWHDQEGDVTVDMVMSHMAANGKAVGTILRELVERGLPERTCACAAALNGAVMTDRSLVSDEEWNRLGLLFEDSASDL
jgi:5'-methylthioadenosine phosphorylase